MRFFFREIELEVPETVYYPREDSILLAETIEEISLENKKCLEIGCGSGLASILMAKKGAFVISADIDKNAILCAQKNARKNSAKIFAVKSDLFEKINGKFDLIIFNPPYLPQKDTKYLEKIKHQIFGGKTGREIIAEFLKQFKNHLNKNGKIFLLISSETGEEKVLELCRDFSYKILKRKKIPWEELILIELF